MRLLNLPNHAILFHPYVQGVSCDEPEMRDVLGFRGGGCKMLCCQCEYRLNDGMYNPVRHKNRDFAAIKVETKKAERALRCMVGGPGVKANKDDKAAYERLYDQGVYATLNPFHTVPMGYR